MGGYCRSASYYNAYRLHSLQCALRHTGGIFSGIWHGWIAPISLVLSIFTDARIYEVNNTGFFYDLGFYMAIISGFGSLALSRKKKD